MPQHFTPVKELTFDFGGRTPIPFKAASDWFRLLYNAIGCYI
jgi:hypothetical protein